MGDAAEGRTNNGGLDFRNVAGQGEHMGGGIELGLSRFERCRLNIQKRYAVVMGEKPFCNREANTAGTARNNSNRAIRCS